MCGHDGHTACLAAAVPLFLARAKQVPSNKRARLIFQPAEEAVGERGARVMIEAGCLAGVDEIYGFHNHNIPLLPFGYFSCKEGPIMASITYLKVSITGTGGHGSEPESLKYALPKAIAFYEGLMKLDSELKEKYGNVFTIMLPVLKAGERYNVISESVVIEGNLRAFST
jgi:amidohydrolase